MQSIEKLPNAAATQITVTSTATGLNDLITAAASETFIMDFAIDALDFQVETNDLRYLVDGNTPTASVGILLEAGSVKQIRGADLGKLKLIATGANVVVNIQIGKTVR